MRDKIAIIVKILKTRSSIWTEMEDKLVMGAESRESARQSVTWGKLVDKNFAVKFNPFYVQTGLVLPGLRIQHFINARFLVPVESIHYGGMELMREIIIRGGRNSAAPSPVEPRLENSRR
ncbi:uncharacterized protein LOC118433177 [Folsomia candida]|uniref:uncharacterized protein LOC118433177 n=1 Tax=Folsomia candida TaxID=158441 RepID=UPI0016053864|nr:uncharacterized protein LOC118433177 [Folsomia candida]